MLLRTDIRGKNAWHNAAFGGKLDVIKNILEWAKERLTTKEMKNEMLFRTGTPGNLQHLGENQL